MMRFRFVYESIIFLSYAVLMIRWIAKRKRKKTAAPAAALLMREREKRKKNEEKSNVRTAETWVIR